MVVKQITNGLNSGHGEMFYWRVIIIIFKFKNELNVCNIIRIPDKSSFFHAENLRTCFLSQ